MKAITRRGRPRTSDLTRAEQLRAAKRAQRQRERRGGLKALELRLPVERARQLRVAAAMPGFEAELASFLDDRVIDIEAWPALKDLAWNRADRYIAAPEALALYERNWRFVDPALLEARERALIERLKDRYGAGVFDG